MMCIIRTEYIVYSTEFCLAYVFDQCKWYGYVYVWSCRKMITAYLTTFDPDDTELIQGVDFHKQKLQKGALYRTVQYFIYL